MNNNEQGAVEPRPISFPELAAITGRTENWLRVAGKNGLFAVSRGRVDLAKAVRAIIKDQADRAEAKAIQRVKKSKKVNRRVALLDQASDAHMTLALEMAQIGHELTIALAELEGDLPDSAKASADHLAKLVGRLKRLADTTRE
ncbi:hypothetical protein BMI86_00035 [Thioclava sp. DLFJ5-1]|uniref:hypothetical protein n=1 Tax=Thioclava sp. DLFJ5-1 TaxID=1915314 RepID=UPI000995ECF2|nr:hypothetical protein [Thioclava sp. DLFJ5-1]OOY21024.1 hypothetical protein BMI86_00035 [Thioclava sp. DLFJ5-1]